MKELTQATSMAAQYSESEAAIEIAKTTILLAKRASNYIFYGSYIIMRLQKTDTIGSMLDEFIRISSESKMTDDLMIWKKI